MSPDDWDQVKHAFAAALNLPPAEREAFVAVACAHRPELVAAVNELLRAHGEASQGFLSPGSIVFASRWLFQSDDRVAGRFTVVRRIARGSMGEVYQAFDERLRLDIALKAIRPELIEDPETVERFRREVLVTRDIAHESLCRIFDLVEHTVDVHHTLPPGTVVPCLTMQFVEGETLEDWLAPRRPLSVADAMPLLEQIAGALQVLHDAGVVHRDLKPSNVMLTPDGGGVRAVLTDFGLAKPLEDAIFETQAGVQGGAPFFMAPELFRGQRPSVASDVYAFGLLIDEMITTSRAFAAEALHGLLLQKLKGSPEPPSRRGSTAPRHWDRTIQCCLAQDPRDRYRSVTQAMAALESQGLWGRWHGTRQWLRSAYFPRRWRPVRYSAAGAAALSAFLAFGSTATPGTPASVAIWRFENLSKDPDLDYLARGTAAELGRRLSRVPNLQVYSQVDSAPSNPALAATYALRGHIQRAGAQLRINVQLNEIGSGRLLWSQNFDGSADESLNLQDELASATVGQLLRPLRHSTRWADRLYQTVLRPTIDLPSNGTNSSAAFDAYLRGKTLFEERTVESALEAIRFLRRALREDPNFAAAYAALADVQGVLIDLQYAPADQLIDEADRYVTQAVTIDPTLPEAQLTLGFVRQMQWRWADAEAAYLRAIDLHPTSARARRWYGGLLLQFGRFEEALALHRLAMELDPYDFPSQSAYGHALLNAGRPVEAAAHLEQVLAKKDLLYAHALLGQAYAELARRDVGRRQEYLQKALRESTIVRGRETPIRVALDGPVATSPLADLIAALAWSQAGEPLAAEPYLARLTAGRAMNRVSAGYLARVYAAQGLTTEAIASLLEAEQARDRELYYINVAPVYAGIRDQPQFRALVDRIHLSR